MKKFLPLLPITLILAGSMFMHSCSDEPSTEPASNNVLQIDGAVYLPEGSSIYPRLHTEVAERSLFTQSIQAPATVEANPSQRANIFPPAGGRIVRLLVNMGQSVTADQPLFELYSPDIAEIVAVYNTTRSSALQAERALSRAEDLFQRGILSRREYEEASTEYEIAQSELEAASMTLQILGIDLSEPGRPLTVRSPINGRVVDLQVAAGEFIAEPDEPLMIIADLSNVWVTASIQEKDIRHVGVGMAVEARFSAYPDEVYEGDVLFISDILDEETRTTRVRIEFDNPDRKLKPGMFASVTFRGDTEELILVPSTALLQGRDFNYLFVETEPRTYERRRVRTGASYGDRIVILEGIEPGETIVTRNAILIP